jgi:hypothetical protein
MSQPFYFPKKSSFRLLAGLFFLSVLGLTACDTDKGDSKNTNETGTTAGQSSPVQMADHPVLTLDEVHNALWQDSAQVFLIRPHEQLTLKQADYVFHIPTDMNRPDVLKKFGITQAITGPNMVHVLYNDNLYKTPWMPSEGQVAVRASSLGGGQNNQTFDLFDAGNTVFVFVGYEGNATEVGAEAPFAPFYALRILVDENPLRFIKQPGQSLPIKKDPTVSIKP